MSTLRINTISNAAGSASVPVDTVVSGSAKAWVNFNGTGTVAIRAAFNVSSITDNGVGQYTVNFTNAMPDANFGANITLQGGNAYIGTINARATSSLSMFSWTSASAFYDATDVCVSIFR